MREYCIYKGKHIDSESNEATHTEIHRENWGIVASEKVGNHWCRCLFDGANYGVQSRAKVLSSVPCRLSRKDPDYSWNPGNEMYGCLHSSLERFESFSLLKFPTQWILCLWVKETRWLLPLTVHFGDIFFRNGSIADVSSNSRLQK